VRRGVTAIPPYANFENKPYGVVDMACFPGSSGSPIYIVEKTGEKRLPDVEDKFLGINGRVALLGILFAGPQITTTGEIIIEDAPVAARPISVTSSMMHLGYYVKANELLVFEDVVREMKELGETPAQRRKRLNQ
jgi:hypothetical protein